jgi:hypothetical protein
MHPTIARFLVLLSFAFLSSSTALAQFTVTHYAGRNMGDGYTDGNGTQARVRFPLGMALDPAGNLYFTDQNTIRSMSPAGRISTVAGLPGVRGSADGHGINARFSSLMGIAFGPDGNVYVADRDNNSIRRVTPRGDVMKFVDVPSPNYLVFDSQGSLFITSSDYAVRKITPAGAVSVFAGEPGVAGYPPRFGVLGGIAIDASDTLYVADAGNGLLRPITAAGVVGTGTALPARYASWLAHDGHGTLYLTTTYAFHIMKLDGTLITTIPRSGMQDGPMSSAKFFAVDTVLPAPNGDLYVSDWSTIRRVSNGMVTTIAGLRQFPPNVRDGAIGDVDISLVNAAEYDKNGNLFIGDDYSIRKITPQGTVTTLATGFTGVTDIAIDANGSLYAADGLACVIHKVSPIGSIEIFAGKHNDPGYENGFRGEARFHTPGGLTLDSAGNLYVTDYDNHQIRKITPAGAVSTFAGSATLSPGDADGVAGAARFYWPWGIDIDASGNLYVAEWGRPRVRKITPAGVVSTFAGSTTRGIVDATGSAARFMYPTELEVDDTGVYVSDSYRMIRRIGFDGAVTSLAGVDTARGAVEGTGSIARFNRIAAIASSGGGRLVVGDEQNLMLWSVRPPGLTDKGTASTVTPAMYSTVQLGTDTNTATTWTWSILRRPPGSTAELSATSIRNPTFTPDVADRFTLLLRAENANGVRFSTVDLDPVDTCAPLSAVMIAMNGSAETCAAGTGGTATASATGGGEFMYQWGWRATPDGTTTSIGGATSQWYTIDGSDFGGEGTKYLVVTVTSSCGGTATSNPTAVTIRALRNDLAITAPEVQANSDQNTASVADAGFGATYVWSITNGTIVAGQGSRTIRFLAGPSGTVEFQVAVTNRGGCTDTGSLVAPIQGGAGLYILTPCRVVDSRHTTAIPADGMREVIVAGTCGVPADARSVALNVAAVAPSSTGWLAIYAADLPFPGVSTMNYRTGRTRANNAVLKLSPDGRLMVKNSGPAVHFIVDVTGYFK